MEQQYQQYQQLFHRAQNHALNSLRLDPSVAVIDVTLTANFSGTPVAGSTSIQPAKTFNPVVPAQIAPNTAAPAMNLALFPGSVAAYLQINRWMFLDSSSSTTYQARAGFVAPTGPEIPLFFCTQGQTLNQSQEKLVSPYLYADPGVAIGNLQLYFYSASGTALNATILLQCSYIFMYA